MQKDKEKEVKLIMYNKKIKRTEITIKRKNIKNKKERKKE